MPFVICTMSTKLPTAAKGFFNNNTHLISLTLVVHRLGVRKRPAKEKQMQRWRSGVRVGRIRSVSIWWRSGGDCMRLASCRFHRRDGSYVIRSLRSLGFFRPPKAILVPGMYFLGFSRYSNCGARQSLSSCHELGAFCPHTNVSSFHSMPFALFASVYEKPSTCPVFRPKRPCRLGPTLFPSPSLRL